MRLPLLATALVLPLITSCSAGPGARPAPDDGPRTQVPPGEAAGAATSQEAFGSAAEAGTAAATGRQGGLTAAELALLNSEGFRRRFIESYLSETDVEPTVTVEERETMTEVLGLISPDEPDAQPRLEEAARLLMRNIGESSSAVFDFTLANIRYQQEDYEKAAVSYADAVRKFPRFRRAWGNLGQIRYRQGDHAGAIEAMSKVISLGGGDAVTYGLLGVSHSRLEHDIAAESAFRMASLLDPATLDWKLGLGSSFFRQGRYADAAALFGALIEEKPDRADFWLAQGEAWARMGKTMEAAENFELVDRLGASTPDSLNNLGDIYANEKLYDLAVGAYLRALDKDPRADPKRWIRAARFLGANGARDEVRRLVDGIEKVQGERLGEDERKELLKLRARLAVAEGKGDEEARILEEVVGLDPLDGDALILLGRHSMKRSEFEKASFWFERAASLEVFEADAKLGLAQVLVRQRRYAEALPLIRRSQELEPRDYVQKFLEQVEARSQNR
ncbi:MAG: tetratricopeptide repeat protein [Planctomycetota bacterium]